MSTNPTKNPIPSESPRDLKFNAGKIDEIVNSQEEAYSDRFGLARLTWAGIEAMSKEALSNYGYVNVESFEDGATLTAANQVLHYVTGGEYYRWNGTYPKVVPAGSTPQSTGGISTSAWVSVGDASLRSQLSSASTAAGDALIAVKQPFSSSAQRTQHSKNADILDAADWGIEANSTQDQTLKFGLMISEAAGRKVRIGKGSYVANISATNNISLVGDGFNDVTIKRPANSVSPYFVAFNGAISVQLSGITFDGNKASNGTPADNVFISSDCKSFEMKSCRSISAFGANGLRLGSENSLKGDAGIRVIKNSQFEGADNFGVRLTRITGVVFDNNTCQKNGDNGIMVDYTTFPPVSGSQQRISITNNRLYENTSAGIFVSGFTEGGTTAAPLYGVGANANFTVIVTGNHVYRNKRYGMAVQANGFIVSDNICIDNGDYTAAAGSAYAGILINGSNGTINNNLCRGNSGYGMDLGGTQYFTCNNNTVMENATQAGGGFVGINLGACQYGTISNNTVGLNGPTGYGTQILVPGYDGGNTSFQTLTTALNITGNTLILGFGSSRIGIRLYGRPLECSVSGNKTTGGSKFTSIAIETNEPVYVSGNSHSDSDTGVSIPAVLNAAAIVVPDFADEVRVTGSNATMTNLLTYSSSIYLNKISETFVTAAGSGYDPLNPPTVTFSGGGGSGATAFAAIDGSGKLISVNIINAGSGYTTTPTISISAPPSGGTQAAASARVGVINFEGRKIRMYIENGTTIQAGNNIVLPGSTASIAVPANGIVDFMGNVAGKFVLAGKSF